MDGNSGKMDQVLNALRHQRFDHLNLRILVQRRDLQCSTPYGIRGLITRGGRAGHPTKVRCSTPYGIRGLITVSDRQVVPKNRVVLNALRHQRFDHWEHNAGKTNRPAVLNALRHQRFDHELAGLERAF